MLVFNCLRIVSVLELSKISSTDSSVYLEVCSKMELTTSCFNFSVVSILENTAFLNLCNFFTSCFPGVKFFFTTHFSCILIPPSPPRSSTLVKVYHEDEEWFLFGDCFISFPFAYSHPNDCKILIADSSMIFSLMGIIKLIRLYVPDNVFQLFL